MKIHVSCARTYSYMRPWSRCIQYKSICLIRATVATPARDSMIIPTAIQYCEVWWNLLDKCIWSYSSLLLAWIINGYFILQNVFSLATSLDKIIELHVFDTCLCITYHVFCIMSRIRFFGNDNFFVIFDKVKLIIQWIYIIYRMVGFKDCQTELVIAIAQIYGRKIARRYSYRWA